MGLLFLLPGGPLQAQEDSTIEYPEDGTDAVATYTAVDPEGTAIASWTLTGTDADAFTIEGGVLRFAKTPDYETPADEGGTGGSTAVADDNMYEITVQAMDSTGKTAMKEVMVEVTNVDEDGTVTLSARRPLADVAFTAELTDPDGAATNPKWQWAKSMSKNGSYTDIDNAEAATYTPTDASGKSDAGFYLQATVSYTDPEGSGKNAMMKSDYTVRATRGSNSAPEFAADQDPVMDGDQDDAAREVAENTEAGTDIGAPLVATDEDSDDVLTYTLTGDEADPFAIDWATGQIMTKAALDFETKPSYRVVVRATDPAGSPQEASAVALNSDEVTVVITVTDVNEAPAVAGEATVTFNEDTGDIDTALATYTATDPDTGDPAPIWSVAGPDGGKFTAMGGELEFKAKPDHENSTDANGDNVYEVTVQASDGKLTGMMKVKVTVENENENGVVTLSKTQPRVGIAVTASLTDPDGSISSLTWQWSNDDDVIPDANSDTYTPVTGDVGDTLTATASYTDGQGEGASKTAMKGSANTVALDTRNKPPAFADQDSKTDGVQNDMATRKVDENTKAVAADDAPDASEDTADNVGAVVMATDPDPNAETPTYTLGGADAAKFRVRANGQIEVGSGTELDYETKTTYMVTLTAEDSFGSSSSIMVTIEVNPIDEVPEIVVGGLAISGPSSPDYPENGTGAVENYTASGPNAASATWTLGGDDAGDFSISSNGVLSFRSSPNFEMAADADTDNTYMVSVKADVTDVNEAPAVAGEATVTFNEDTGDIDTALATYTATDPDTGDPAPIWSVAGPDGGKFTAMGGELEFKAKPDHENSHGRQRGQRLRGDGAGLRRQAHRNDEGEGHRRERERERCGDPVEDAARVGIAVTASLTDPDGSISSLTWQWSNDDDVIPDANSDTYTPVTGDVGDTLTATASYTDGQGEGASKTAMKGSANTVALDTRNKPPAFADQDSKTDGVQNDMATRKVDENTKAVAADDAPDASEDTADNVGAVVMATDPDPNAETPTYTLAVPTRPSPGEGQRPDRGGLGHGA